MIAALLGCLFPFHTPLFFSLFCTSYFSFPCCCFSPSLRQTWAPYAMLRVLLCSDYITHLCSFCRNVRNHDFIYRGPTIHMEHVCILTAWMMNAKSLRLHVKSLKAGMDLRGWKSLSVWERKKERRTEVGLHYFKYSRQLYLVRSPLPTLSNRLCCFEQGICQT